MRAKVRKGRSIEKEKKMATNKVADYIVITDAPSQIGGLGGQWRFKVPLNIDLNSYAVLYFVLREMDADDVTLNVKINGKPISTPPYLTFNGDDHPFRSMHEVFKLKDVNISLDQDSSPPANQLEFSMNAQDHDYITVSDIVLWFQVDSGKMDAILLDGVHGARPRYFHGSPARRRPRFVLVRCPPVSGWHRFYHAHGELLVHSLVCLLKRRRGPKFIGTRRGLLSCLDRASGAPDRSDPQYASPKWSPNGHFPR